MGQHGGRNILFTFYEGRNLTCSSLRTTCVPLAFELFLKNSLALFSFLHY